MAAKTGATATPITPAKGRRVRILAVPEASSQSGAKGQPAMVSGGYGSAMTARPQTITGFYRNAPQNGASDGAKTASLYLAEDGVPFKATLRDTLAASHRFARALISVNSAGAAFLTIDTNSSGSYQAVIQGWTSEWAIGDVNPEVSFTLIAAKVQSDI
jgi:hypothetical protein